MSRPPGSKLLTASVWEYPEDDIQKTYLNFQHIHDLVILLFRGSERIGEYQYVGDDGKLYTVRYSAGVNGFRILSGDHIPSGNNSDQRTHMALEIFQNSFGIFQEFLMNSAALSCSLEMFTTRKSDELQKNCSSHLNIS